MRLTESNIDIVPRIKIWKTENEWRAGRLTYAICDGWAALLDGRPLCEPRYVLMCNYDYCGLTRCHIYFTEPPTEGIADVFTDEMRDMIGNGVIFPMKRFLGLYEDVACYVNEKIGELRRFCAKPVSIELRNADDMCWDKPWNTERYYSYINWKEIE